MKAFVFLLLVAFAVAVLGHERRGHRHHGGGGHGGGGGENQTTTSGDISSEEMTEPGEDSTDNADSSTEPDPIS